MIQSVPSSTPRHSGIPISDIQKSVLNPCVRARYIALFRCLHDGQRTMPRSVISCWNFLSGAAWARASSPSRSGLKFSDIFISSGR